MGPTLRDALLRGLRRPRRFAEGSPLQYRGDGYEFVELREYQPGDDVRRIDWAATARTAQLQTRVLLEDVALTIAVYTDDSPAIEMGRNRALREAASEISDAWLAAALRSDRTFVLTSLDEAAALPRGAALLYLCDGIDTRLATPDLAHELAFRLDCTLLLARDPWQDDLPLSGFVRVADAATNRTAQLYIGKRERERYYRSSRAREAQTLAQFEDAGWRTAVFTEDDGLQTLLRAFGASSAGGAA